MSNDSFRALMLNQDDDRNTIASIEQLTFNQLPEGDVLVKVSHTGINYKDALAVTGKGRVVRSFPMVPGIDFAGEVVSSATADFTEGDTVVATGWGIGEQYWGGMSEFQRVKSEWLLPLPAGLDARSAMIMGTAGFTAALCVLAIMDWGTTPDDGPVLVTGAGGGVGGVSVMLLSKLGYEVHAVSGRASLNDYLKSIGATEIHSRKEFSRESKPLEKENWAAAVDSVGSTTLATLLSQVKSEGIVAACGLAGGMDLPSTVAPFILRGVTLRGINSVYAPVALRKRAWQLIADNLTAKEYEALVDHEISLDQVSRTCEELLEGKIRGRVIIKMNA